MSVENHEQLNHSFSDSLLRFDRKLVLTCSSMLGTQIIFSFFLKQSSKEGTTESLAD